MIDRERSFDFSKLTVEEANTLSVTLGNKVREISDEACEKINSLLKIYGMSAKFQVVIQELKSPAVSSSDKPAPKKRGRKPKQS